ncbi:prolyl aminopeptidase [Pseudonocardia nigra]|uniref:prolyl aminopeptidase n=1 Tax=Pseudonocardia nigra TaxID=1921578 RepID=UPI001C5D812C|nr:prolyl aminopeptidase [Pseudonocardia nigra]
MTDRYPAIEPHATGMLEVTDGHQLYWETVGTPDGTPAVLLHGGPGGGASPGARRNFDPDAYRAVLFDQRGCGRSRPLASEPDADLATNTTDHLVADIERLREHLGIDRWVVLGVSWGVTLALVYAQRHPERVIAMVLAAVTSGERRETDWITRDMGRVFPREWERFADQVPVGERDGDLAAAYARLLADPDPAVREHAALEWCIWEDTHISLGPDAIPFLQHRDPTSRMVFARLVTHYWSNGCFLAEQEVRDGMPQLADIPAVLVHGRYDVSGPLDVAWRLHRAWPGSRLVVVDDAGHGGGSFGSEIVAALDSFRDLT